MPFKEAIPSFGSAGFHIQLAQEKYPFGEATDSSGENGSGPGESGAPPSAFALLLEDGFYLLLEGGGKLLLE